MVDFEEFLKELITTKEILKKLKKNLEKELSSPKFIELKKELINVQEKVSELNKTLEKWTSPDEALDKLTRLRKELTTIHRLLDDVSSQIELVNRSLHLKPKKYSFLFISSIFLIGFVLGSAFNNFFKKVEVNLGNIKFKPDKCLEFSQGIVKISLEGKQFELPANKIKLKICPPKSESGR